MTAIDPKRTLRTSDKMRQQSQPTTILDRAGMAFLTSAVTFISLLVLWALITFGFGNTAVPFSVVWLITGIMGLLGLLFAERLIISILGVIWDAISVFMGGVNK